ncbi:hypothetical protein D3C80_1571140 [compost metagenome]
MLIEHIAVYFGRQHHLLAPSAALLKPAADNLLRPAAVLLASVDIGRIKKVNSRIQRGIHNPESFLLFGLRAKIHRAETELADLEA